MIYYIVLDLKIDVDEIGPIGQICNYSTKARTRLNWTPQYDLKALCNDMMISDIKLMKKETYLKDGGYRIMNYFE